MQAEYFVPGNHSRRPLVVKIGKYWPVSLLVTRRLRPRILGFRNSSQPGLIHNWWWTNRRITLVCAGNWKSQEEVPYVVNRKITTGQPGLEPVQWYNISGLVPPSIVSHHACVHHVQCPVRRPSVSSRRKPCLSHQHHLSPVSRLVKPK